MSEVNTTYIYYAGAFLFCVLVAAVIIVSSYLKKRQLAKKREKQQKLNQIRDQVNTSRNAPPYKNYTQKVVSDDEELRIMEPESFIVSPVPNNFVSSEIEYKFDLDFRRVAALYMCPQNEVCTWCARCKCREPCSFCKMRCKDCDYCPEHREKEQNTNACEKCRIQRDRGAGYIRCTSHLNCHNCESKYRNEKIVPCDKCQDCRRCDYKSCNNWCNMTWNKLEDDKRKRDQFKELKKIRKSKRNELRNQKLNKYKNKVKPLRSAQNQQRKAMKQPALTTVTAIEQRHKQVEDQLDYLELEHQRRLCLFLNKNPLEIDFENEDERLEVILEAQEKGLSLCEPTPLPPLPPFNSFDGDSMIMKNCRGCQKCNTCRFCPSCILCSTCMFCKCMSTGQPCSRCRGCRCYSQKLCAECTACSSCVRCNRCAMLKPKKKMASSTYPYFLIQLNDIRVMEQVDRLRCIRDLEERLRQKEAQAGKTQERMQIYQIFDQRIEFLENSKSYDSAGIIKGGFGVQ